jgi:hypothetical protein
MDWFPVLSSIGIYLFPSVPGTALGTIFISAIEEPPVNVNVKTVNKKAVQISAINILS